jgi:endonuclease YncB( thermonuclease family)
VRDNAIVSKGQTSFEETLPEQGETSRDGFNEMRRKYFAAYGGLIALSCVLAAPAFGQTLVDGDTIKLNGTTWRLWGIDAPETSQFCGDGWPAGLEAKRILAFFLRAGPVDCEPRGKDRHGRALGQCRAGGKDLGADMVWAGMAWASSSDYLEEEQAALQARRGVHTHGCERAWDWRANRR